MTELLYAKERACCACGATSRINAGPDREVNICAVSPLIYRRGMRSKRMLKNCPRVTVCERCLICFIAGGPAAPGFRFITALRESMAAGYSAHIEAEKKCQ